MKLKKALAIVFVIGCLSVQTIAPVQAKSLGEEVGKKLMALWLGSNLNKSEVYGAVDLQNSEYGTKMDKSIEFVNKLIGFATAVASIWLLVTIIVNGMTIINNDKGPEAFNTAAKNIAISVLGLAISSLAFVATQYVGLTLFGNKDAFTNPLSQVKAPDKSPANYDVPANAEQVFGTPAPELVANDYKETTGPGNFVANVVAVLAAAAALWLLYSLVWNGIKLITTNKADAIATATRNITYSIIGFLIAVMAYVITNYVTTLLLGNNKLLEDPVSEQLLKK